MCTTTFGRSLEGERGTPCQWYWIMSAAPRSRKGIGKTQIMLNCTGHWTRSESKSVNAQVSGSGHMEKQEMENGNGHGMRKRIWKMENLNSMSNAKCQSVKWSFTLYYNIASDYHSKMRHQEISRVHCRVLLRVQSTSNNTYGNEWAMFPRYHVLLW